MQQKKVIAEVGFEALSVGSIAETSAALTIPFEVDTAGQTSRLEIELEEMTSEYIRLRMISHNTHIPSISFLLVESNYENRCLISANLFFGKDGSIDEDQIGPLNQVMLHIFNSTGADYLVVKDEAELEINVLCPSIFGIYRRSIFSFLLNDVSVYFPECKILSIRDYITIYVVTPFDFVHGQRPSLKTWLKFKHLSEAYLASI